MNAQTVNAYYNPGTNEITFPAAILRPPFFDPEADPAVNYGGIGAVIGHEIGHGFDDQGSQYDGEGNLVDWWTEDDRTQFTERADKLIEQYSGFEPRDLPGHKVNGALTVGREHRRPRRADDRPPGVPDQPRRRRAARRSTGCRGRSGCSSTGRCCWRIKARDELAKQLLSVDPHSPAEFRANIARNLDEFHEAFATAPGDGLWLEPADRVRIW